MRHGEVFYQFINEMNRKIIYTAIRGFRHLPDRPDTDIDLVYDYAQEAAFRDIAKHYLLAGPLEDWGTGECAPMRYQPFFTPGARDESLPNGCFRVDSYNAPFFRSPMNGGKRFYTLPEDFRRDLLREARLDEDWGIFIPHPAQEVVLISCRCLLDRGGQWAEKHRIRVKELLPAAEVRLGKEILRVFPAELGAEGFLRGCDFEGLSRRYGAIVGDGIRV